MKKMSMILKCTLGVCMGLMVLQSCEERAGNDQLLSPEEEMEIVAGENESENFTEEDLLLIDEATAAKSTSGGRMKAKCAAVTRDSISKTITIDFGDGCVGRHGRERSGKIIITYGGSFNDRMANRVITFDHYFINNKNITGAIELRDINRNDADNLTSTRSWIGYTVHFPDGSSFVLNGSTTMEWLEGEGDDVSHNNVFSITGAYEGLSTRGRKFTHTITSPVIVDFNCRAQGGFIRVSGIKEMKINKADREKTRTINYGDGTCDNEITITINGKVHTITTS